MTDISTDNHYAAAYIIFSFFYRKMITINETNGEKKQLRPGK